MKNFEFYNPTRLVFGKGQETRIGELIVQKAGSDANVLIVYGGQSAKKSGLLDRVIQSLKDSNLNYLEFGGVRPNPTYEKVVEGIEIARKKGINVLLAVGGGSVIDTAKAIAIGVPYEGECWDFFAKRVAPLKALPVACVLTIPAAGSEQSQRIVISHKDRKLGAGSDVVRPFASVVNPELFFTLPQKQITAGVIDMMSHIMERYFTQTEHTDFVSGQAEAALRCIMANGLKLKKDHTDYDAWCQVGIAGSFAHNGFYGLGQVEDWACHGIEHEISAWDEKITHGEGLAVVTPAWMKYVWKENPKRFVQFAVNVMQIKPQETEEKTALAGIEALKDFFRKVGAPVTLRELSSEQPDPLELAQKALVIPGTLGNFKKLGEQDIVRIFELMN